MHFLNLVPVSIDVSEQFRDLANVNRGEETICYTRDNKRPCPIFMRATITKEWHRPQRQAGDKVDKRPPMAYNEWIVRTSPTRLSFSRLPSAPRSAHDLLGGSMAGR